MSEPVYRIEVTVTKMEAFGQETLYSFDESSLDLTAAAKDAIYDLEQVAYYRKEEKP